MASPNCCRSARLCRMGFPFLEMTDVTPVSHPAITRVLSCIQRRILVSLPAMSRPTDQRGDVGIGSGNRAEHLSSSASGVDVADADLQVLDPASISRRDWLGRVRSLPTPSVATPASVKPAPVEFSYGKRRC